MIDDCEQICQNFVFSEEVSVCLPLLQSYTGVRILPSDKLIRLPGGEPKSVRLFCCYLFFIHVAFSWGVNVVSCVVME